MTFELVRLGWPNAAAVLALAAVPFMPLMLPAGKPPISSQVESVQTGDQQPIGVAGIIAE
jgi:hypothetical protein